MVPLRMIGSRPLMSLAISIILAPPTRRSVAHGKVSHSKGSHTNATDSLVGEITVGELAVGSACRTKRSRLRLCSTVQRSPWGKDGRRRDPSVMRDYSRSLYCHEWDRASNRTTRLRLCLMG
ncbi:hypothetical protein EV424DRAFT_289964 [Suillus variegatus]|nr:hypothetical protein EV424DRAFT_289964 [Suillus variegatus]